MLSKTHHYPISHRCVVQYSGNCGQFSPTDKLGGSQGWALAGSCDGSIGPTSSPNFERLGIVTGCPKEYSSSTLEYMPGDRIAVTVSTSPLRQAVYECKPWPQSGYCNQVASSMAPGKEAGDLGWTLVGACEGTLTPTGAPSTYGGTCTYTRCVEETNCIPGSLSNGIQGSSGCSCASGDDTRSYACKQSVCTITDVEPYKASAASSYGFGDVVRIGVNRFKCRAHPNGLWCKQSAYVPRLSSGIWTDAW